MGLKGPIFLYMTLIQRLENLLSDPLKAEGFDIVRIQLSGSQRPVLQFMIEKQDGTPLTVESCTKANRLISAFLDVEDPIKKAYTLEVSSPGIDRPLVKKKDFERFCGQKVKLETHHLVEDRKRFQGTIESVQETTVTLFMETENSRIAFPFDVIHKCKLIPDWSTLLKQDKS